MKKLLVINLNNKDKAEPYSCLTPEIQTTQFWLHGSLDKAEEIESYIREQGPFDYIVFDYLSSDKLSELACQNLINRLFLGLKAIYRPVMRQRYGKVWVISRTEDQNIQESILTQVADTGAKSLVQVAAMELARKKISLNFIKLGSENTQAKLNQLLTWENAPFSFMTAQELVY